MDFKPKHSASSLNIFTIMTSLAKKENAWNLSQGLPDYPIAPELADLLKEAVVEGYNQYPPMPGLKALRENISIELNKRYQTDFCNPDVVTITPGATYSIFTALTSLIDRGDEVIYLEPAFDCYLPAIEINGGVPVKVTLSASDNFALDWQKIKEAISEKTKAILVNTPHNPTGYIWTQEDWRQLAELIGEKDIFVISDEVYDNIIFDGKKHNPGFLQPSLEGKVISLYSFGKTFHITGWKIGYVVASEALTSAFRSVHQYLTFSVNSPAQYALARYLEMYNPLEASLILQKKRDLLIDELKESHLIKLNTSEGTYFQLYNYSAISDLPDTEFAKWLTTEYKVATIPLSAFFRFPQNDKIVRLCFAKRDEVLIKAAAQLRKI